MWLREEGLRTGSDGLRQLVIMAKLKDILDVDLLRHHLLEGIVRRQVHPLYPNLFIYNYTERAQFERIWDNVTNVTRGLIVDENEDEVIARGYNKFHNLNTEYVPETLEANLPSVLPLVTKKLDGSMGIQYYWDNQLWIATRGSFNSEQARWATDWIRKHPSQDDLLHYATVGNDHTLIYEIIYKENRIVVDYDFEGLVLTGCVEIETGAETDHEVLQEIGEACSIMVVQKFDKSLSECAASNLPNEEGYVLTYDKGDNVAPLKVKVKFTEYCRLHRILTGLNPKAIWEMLAAGQGEAIDLILNDPKMPKEFIRWFSSWVNLLRKEFRDMWKEANDTFITRPWQVDWAHESVDPKLARKETALYFQKHPRVAPVLFAMLDGKSEDPIIWKLLKVKAADETFKKDGE